MRTLGFAAGLWALASVSIAHPGHEPDLTPTTEDGVVIHGYVHEAENPTDRPVILLFHQGGSNARGEYGEINNWLGTAGYTTIGWDLRVGGSEYGSLNLTAEALPGDATPDYCDAAADVDTAIAASKAAGFSGPFILWGSSYSGALVFGAAARHPGDVAGVIAFSPATGAPLADCLARETASAIEAPKMVFRPTSEMARASSQEQKTVLEKSYVRFVVVKDGVHGSSMLVDERTGHDMSAARTDVMQWLRSLD